MARSKAVTLYSLRYYFLLLLLLGAMAGLVWRMIDLTVLDRDFLLRQGDARTLRILETPAYRGMITDRNGEPLAISTPVESVWVNPKDFNASMRDLLRFADILQLSANTIQERLKQAGTREFVYLKRGLGPAVAAKIRALSIPGVYLQREFRRFYPEAEVTAHVLGFTNIDDKGQEGIELAFDKWLRGYAGKKRVLKDRLGHIVADVGNIQEPRPGHNLILSIDRRIQYQAYRALKAAVEKYQAVSGSAVVLDIKTGEVLAMVNQPSYNPNQRHKKHVGRFRNRTVTDVFEPGSVMKAFTLTAGLVSGQYKPDTKINTAPGWFVVSWKTFKDHRNYGRISISEILERSSNVGVIKMTLSLEPDLLWRVLKKVGFGERTGSGFPGESTGVLTKHRVWRPIELSTLAFGYGLSVTPLQIARAYSLFGNDGRLLPVSLLRVNKPVKGKQVVEPWVAHEMLAMLNRVVEHGTARKAKIKGYTVAGKTGTARKLGADGNYQLNHHVATFAGIAPVSHPRLVVVVMLNDPRNGKYYASTVAVPVFSEIMGATLRILDISPDKQWPKNKLTRKMG